MNDWEAYGPMEDEDVQGYNKLCKHDFNDMLNSFEWDATQAPIDSYMFGVAGY